HRHESPTQRPVCRREIENPDTSPRAKHKGCTNLRSPAVSRLPFGIRQAYGHNRAAPASIPRLGPGREELDLEKGSPRISGQPEGTSLSGRIRSDERPR